MPQTASLDTPIGSTNESETASDLVVYTAIFGDRDHLRPCLFPDVRHVCFTDNRSLRADGWTIRASSCADPVLTARSCKIMAERCFPHSKYSLWIDGNMQLRVDPRELVTEFLAGADLATFLHPERRCAYTEAEVVNHLGLDKSHVVNLQMERYAAEGFPRRYGLLETAIFIRRHTPQICKLDELWWSEVAGGSRRDQLSLMYAIWKTRTNYNVIPGGREINPIAKFYPHKPAGIFSEVS